jgi:hypothetical protein
LDPWSAHFWQRDVQTRITLVLASAGCFGFGCTLAAISIATRKKANLEPEETQVLVGLGALVLGILGLVGIAPITMVLVALLATGASILLRSSFVGGLLLDFLRVQVQPDLRTAAIGTEPLAASYFPTVQYSTAVTSYRDIL